MAGKSLKRIPTAQMQRYAAVPITDPTQIAELEAKLSGIDRSASCLISIGWGAGLLSKTPWIEKDQDGEQYRQILRNLPLYRKAIDSGMPFPKTRRILFQENKPASLPGWALLDLG